MCDYLTDANYFIGRGVESIRDCFGKGRLDVININHLKKGRVAPDFARIMEERSMNILLVKGKSQYGVLDHFIDALAEEFERMGYEVYNWDLKHETKLQVEALKRKRIELAISMNAIYVGEWSKVLNNQDCLIWNFFVDHPMHHTSRIYQLWDNQISSFVDYEHVEYVRKYFPHIENLVYMPHGGMKGKADLEYSERKYDVVFMGSYTDVKSSSREFLKYSEDMQDIFLNIAEQMSLGHGTMEKLFLRELENRGVILRDDEVAETVAELGFLDNYVRNFNRVMMLEEIAGSGIHIHVYGNGWEEYENPYSEYLHIHEAIPFDETIRIMSNAKIVLNNLPLFRNGSHERVFTSMLCGALCISEGNPYLEQQFIDDEEIVFFSYDKLSELPGKIRYLLENQEEACQIARKGYEQANKRHTWFHRANQILEEARKLKRERSIKRILENDWVDVRFNQIIQYVENNTQEQIYELIKASYFALSRRDRAAMESMEASYKNYPYWGKLSMKDRQYELIEQRATQLKGYLEEFIWLYQKVQDSTSKKILCNILKHWITFEHQYLGEVMGTKFSQYFDKDIIQCDEQEVFVDIGAYNGDTLISYLDNYKNYRKIFCYELDRKNYDDLLTVASFFENVEVKNNVVGDRHGEIVKINIESERSESSRINDDVENSKTSDFIDVRMVSIDEDIHEKITFIKMDVEGAERYVLNGAKQHISNEKPKLAVCIYHGNEDLWKIPRLIDALNDNYKFYIRYYGGNLYPNEIVLYAV